MFQAKGAKGKQLLAGWLAWAKRSRLPAFVKLARTIDKYRLLIWNTLNHGLSNARVEATNTHLRVLTRRAYGFHSPEALIAMAMLTRGGLCPNLPGRAASSRTYPREWQETSCTRGRISRPCNAPLVDSSCVVVLRTKEPRPVAARCAVTLWSRVAK